MIREKVRPLEKLPLKVKLAYTKILALMLMTDRELDQLKLAALYRLMARIKITSAKRHEVLEAIYKGDLILDELVNHCNEGLNIQEKNILRFSLYKDILIIMRANYLEDSEAELLLGMISELFDITEEHKRFFDEELKRDIDYFEGDKPVNLINEAVVEAAARASAIGIPLVVLCYNGYIEGLGALGVLSGLHQLGKKITRKHSFLAGIAITIGLGMLTYNSTKYLLNSKDRYSNRLKKLMAEDMQELQQLAVSYLETDISYMQTKIQFFEAALYNNDRITHEDILFSLKRAMALLKNTKPVVL